ncbi:hypothetical protein LTR53_017097, partial [Teratosphaeriaceae sp. CCFEE 6253]
VVKKWSHQFGSCDLYVTDYTENKAVWYHVPPEEQTGRERDGDDYGHVKSFSTAWPGPYGWHVLKVNVKDPHSHFVNEHVNVGDTVLLRNVKMKIMAEGAKLEGDIWRDDLNPSRVNVLKLVKQEVLEVQELLARKEKYWAKRAALQPPADEAAKPTKAEKKRQKKQRQQEERARAAAAAAAEAPVAERNKHVRCSNQEVALMSVTDVLDLENIRHTNPRPDGTSYVLPFVNTQYRTKAHVVDFWPRSLADFALAPLPQDDEHSSPINEVEWDASQKHEWYFSLLLEDMKAATTPTTANAEAAQPRMWVHVRHEDAQFLFGNDMDNPQDLRTNSQMLAKLREKMCILWGNLEEKEHGDNLNNRPFELCIQEYGIELDDGDPEKTEVLFGYKKLFRMFGTTIL